MAAPPRIAIVHDYLTQFGGAERVVIALARAFPGAAVHTAFFDPDATFPELSQLDVRPLLIDRIAPLRRHHRLALPVLAPAFSTARIDADIAVCSSSGWAHGVRFAGRKIVYCHNTAHWLYLTDEYVPADARAMRAVLGVIGRPLRRWDQRAAAGAQRYVVNSSRSRERVRATYGIEAEVVHPPPAITVDGPQRPVADVQPGFVLCVSRLVEYKNVRALVDAAARRPNLALVVVGSGPLRAELEALAPSNATFLGAVADDQLRWLYDQCAALVGPAYEEFGLTPLEAAAFGKPTIALRYGGYLDTVQEDATGLFFDEPTPDAIGAVLDRMDEVVWDPSRLRQHAESFAEARFIDRMRAIVDLEARLGGFGPLDPLD